MRGALHGSESKDKSHNLANAGTKRRLGESSAFRKYGARSLYHSGLLQLALHGATATTPPCGFNLIELGPDNFTIDMGFEIDDRFIVGDSFRELRRARDVNRA